MRWIVCLATLLAASGLAQVAQAQGSLTVDVNGVRGSNVSTWTFSGSYTVAAGPFGPKDFTHDEGELIGGDISVANDTFNLQDFGFLSSTAQVVGSSSGVHLLDGIHLDSDTGVLPDDDFAWSAPGVFQTGETLTFSGTATIALDMNLFLAPGEDSRSISLNASFF